MLMFVRDGEDAKQENSGAQNLVPKPSGRRLVLLWERGEDGGKVALLVDGKVILVAARVGIAFTCEAVLKECAGSP